MAQSNSDCLDCHSDPDLTMERKGREVALFVDADKFDRSVHAELECIDCHEDAAVEDLPHEDFLESVDCSNCHSDAQEKFDKGIHGQALRKRDIYAPTCSECHGTHNILRPTNPESYTYKMNIPVLCGKCHREGAPVARAYNISEHNILENYTQSIHGVGLFKKGLIVSATCNDCHGNHLILPHTNPNSSISLNKIARTCMVCHSRIEQVHTQVIRGELWEEKPGAIPACTDCHPPHKVSRQNIVITISDRACLRCHAKQNLFKVADGDSISMHMDKNILDNSIHKEIPCVKCHSDVSTGMKKPCVTASTVDCSNCHAALANEYFESGHGQAYFRKDPNAPACTTCHGEHDTKSKYDENAKTYRASIPELCGECHKAEGKAAQTEGLAEIDAYLDYSKTVHGRGLTEKGLLPSAVCTDCHTTHHNLKQSDERSSIYPRNIPSTCAICHRGIYKDYVQSVHAINREEVNEKLPTCADCHTAHKIVETERDKFTIEVTDQCGECHGELATTYLQTMHGKAYELGYLDAARCSDCHGAHKVLKISNPSSMVGTKNIVQTCQQCHDDANQRFTGYLTHATHHDKVKYPVIYYTFWAMTSLLITVFGFFGIHTLLWLPRSVQAIRERKKERKKSSAIMGQYYIRRFATSQRITHIFVILSFVLLALTGMMLKFSGMGWAKYLADLLGGVKGAATIHRIAAVTTFGYFFFHLYNLVRLKREKRMSTTKFFLGPNSMMFNKQDIKDFIGTMKWFFGKGPRPQYGRWTYWEKFDYFAVFWGVAIIGISGLMLWFPEFFTILLPGLLINVAQIIHSDEALLAVGFIFTIHFFNTHLRPEAFPMDTVIFTGLVPLEEYKEYRPREYDEMKRSGQLKKRLVKQEDLPRIERYAKIFGGFFLTLGLILIILIIYSVLFGYK
jgi:predicted CXXCH cytochrome family protein